MVELRVTDATRVRSGTTLVANASLRVAPGEFVALLGPNGAGKTTLLRMALGLEPRDGGEAWIAGEDAVRMGSVRRARHVAYLPQVRPLAWPQSVCDVVALGRFAHGAALGRLGEQDRAAVDQALQACDLDHLADRATDTLSGGELGRVHCARALAAQAPLIVADEPVAALDPRHQHRILTVLRQFVDRGGGALVVLHDLNLAARYADRLVWMRGGTIRADGPTSVTLTVQRIAEIYRVRARVIAGDVPTVVINGAVD